MTIDKAKTIADIVKVAQDVVYAHLDRVAKKKAEQDADKKRIAELEAELRQIKEGGK